LKISGEMTNTHFEVALQAIGDGARLEQLVTDLLASEGYDVRPTGKRGPDGGRDALLGLDGEEGILHCSVTSEWASKAHSDAKKVIDEFDQDFDFYIFATNEDPATVKRDRIEEEITNKHGMRTRIYDFETIRNALLGNKENHTLIREHLSVDPGSHFVDIGSEVDKKYEELIERVASRESPESPITEVAPLLSIHVISHEATNENHDRYLEDIPKPPMIAGVSFNSYSRADYRINKASSEEDRVSIYSCLHKDGWIEGVSCNEGTKYEHRENEIRYTIDRTIVDFVERSLTKLDETDILPPYYVYVTLLGFSEHTISNVPGEITFGGGSPIREEEFQLNRVRFDQADEDMPAKMSQSLNQIWQQVGYSYSKNYERDVSENGDYEYRWDPL